MDGFRGNVDLDKKSQRNSGGALDEAFKRVENIFKKMSKKDETEEEFFHKK